VNWVLWSLLANVSALLVEYVNRKDMFGGFLAGLPYTIWPMVVIQVALYYSFKTAPTYMMAAMVFTVGNAVLRVVSNSMFVNEELNWMIGLGVAGMVVSGIVVKVGST